MIFFIHSLIERSEMIITYDLFSFRRRDISRIFIIIYFYQRLNSIFMLPRWKQLLSPKKDQQLTARKIS